MPTIRLIATTLAGKTDTLRLSMRSAVTGAALNDGTDASTEVVANSGHFTFIIDEAPTVLAACVVSDAVGKVYEGFLPIGATLIVDAIPPNNQSTAAIAAELASAVLSVAAQIPAALSGEFSMIEGDTWIQEITSLGDLSNVVEIVVAIKKAAKDPDSAAYLLISSVDGLLVCNGTTTDVDDAGASIAIDDAPTGVITVTVDSAWSAIRPGGPWALTVKTLRPDADYTKLPAGKITVQAGGVDKITT